MNTRYKAGIIYFIVGLVVIIILFIGKIEKIYLLFVQNSPFYWCLGWSAVGVGAGLINTRDHGVQNYKLDSKREQKMFHLILYCGFVLLISAIVAFVVAIFYSELQIRSISISSVKFYALSALIGLVVGFMGHRLQAVLEYRMTKET